MAYATLAGTKLRLRIEDATGDTELNEILSEADATIDNKLKPHTTVPLPSTPDLIKFGANDLAAGIFKRRRVELKDEGDILYDQGLGKIDKYIKAEFKGGVLVR